MAGLSIRTKIIFVVLPLIIFSTLLVGLASYLVATASVTRVTTSLLSFKASVLNDYAVGQWNLLLQNNLVGQKDMEDAAKAAVRTFALSMLRSPSELIFAVDKDGKVAIQANQAKDFNLEISPAESEKLAAMVASKQQGFIDSLEVGGVTRVATSFPLVSFGWEVFITEERASFYGDVSQITRFSLIILASVVVISILLLLAFSSYLTKPIQRIVKVMRLIITSNNFSRKVPVTYNDEIGELSHTFNLMTSELGRAYEQIKSYAFEAIVAQKREMKVRNIFQLYVPKNVINEIFANPDKMLTGDNRDLAILFSDIRNFTSISEKFAPDELVTILNRYFTLMVDVIMDKNGVIDKYIGDAIMAFFGAPVKSPEDTLNSVQAALGMVDALEVFNSYQREHGSQEFAIGIGIASGIVTVGNIGSEKKMNYTVIGDIVNLASRLEGLTKVYKQALLFTENIYNAVAGVNGINCRFIDIVAVKGKLEGVKIYSAKSRLTKLDIDLWATYAKALEAYFARDFKLAELGFSRALAIDSQDRPSQLLLERTRNYLLEAPPLDWTGIEVMHEK